MPGGGYPSISPPPPHRPFQPGLQWHQNTFRDQNRLPVENSSPDSEWVDYTSEERAHQPRESQPFNFQGSSSPDSQWSPDSLWSPDYLDNQNSNTGYNSPYEQTTNDVDKVEFEMFSPDWPVEAFGLGGEVDSSGLEQILTTPGLDWWDDVQDGRYIWKI